MEKISKLRFSMKEVKKKDSGGLKDRDLDLSQKLRYRSSSERGLAISIAIATSRSPIFLGIILHTDMVQP